MNTSLSITRRQMLAMTSMAVFVRPTSTNASSLRVASLDWALLETLLVIGANVVAGAELVQYRKTAIEPEMPQQTADLGLRGTPNLETLRLLQPDLIFNSNFYATLEARLSVIAPVETHAIYVPGQSPLALAEMAMLAIGKRLSLTMAESFAASAQNEFKCLRQRLPDMDGRPVILLNFGDARHFRVFGGDSMFGEVLARLGLDNAWTTPTRYSAFAPIGLEALAGVADAWIVIIPPIPFEAQEMFRVNAFWHALPAIKEGRVVIIDPVNPYGALPAALRFARSIVRSLNHARG